jgi:hypothetical protein
MKKGSRTGVVHEIQSGKNPSDFSHRESLCPGLSKEGIGSGFWLVSRRPIRRLGLSRGAQFEVLCGGCRSSSGLQGPTRCPPLMSLIFADSRAGPIPPHCITNRSFDEIYTVGVDEGFGIYPALSSGCQDLYNHFLEEILQRYKDARPSRDKVRPPHPCLSGSQGRRRFVLRHFRQHSTPLHGYIYTRRIFTCSRRSCYSYPRLSPSKKVGPRLTRDIQRDILLLRELDDYEDEVEYTYISLSERCLQECASLIDVLLTGAIS